MPEFDSESFKFLIQLVDINYPIVKHFVLWWNACRGSPWRGFTRADNIKDVSGSENRFQ